MSASKEVIIDTLLHSIGYYHAQMEKTGRKIETICLSRELLKELVSIWYDEIGPATQLQKARNEVMRHSLEVTLCGHPVKIIDVPVGYFEFETKQIESKVEESKVDERSCSSYATDWLNRFGLK